MKRLLFLSVLLVSMVICGVALGAEPEVGKSFTFQGQLDEYDGVHTIKDSRFQKHIGIAPVTDVKFAPMSVFKCISDNAPDSYKGNIEITAEVNEIDNNWIFLDFQSKTFTCKRIK
jgi:hypothetical protein